MARGVTKTTILNELSFGPLTSYALGVAIDKPQPSVRRTVAALRHEGYDIISRGTGLSAEYVWCRTTGRPRVLNTMHTGMATGALRSSPYATGARGARRNTPDDGNE
jgi:hypothetical protein